jgi:hypothetical protein
MEAGKGFRGGVLRLPKGMDSTVGVGEGSGRSTMGVGRFSGGKGPKRGGKRK